MDNILGNLLNALVEIWKSIGIPQKVSIILIGLLTLGGIGGILYMGTRPDWQILESGMSRETAAKVYDIVKDANIQVKLLDSGRTIMVPSKNVYALRLRISGEGIKVRSDEGDGWDIFDKMSLGMTELQQQIHKQRAQQGELQKMIKELPNIVSCRVMLTPPEKRVFRKTKSRSKASVLLVLRNGSTLSNSQANTIRHLVSSAITNMKPQDVNITDNNGKLLAKQIADEDMENGDVSGHLEIQAKFENLLKEKAEAILTPIVGRDNVVAMVTCEMDFNTIDKVIEDYNPDRKVVVSEKIVTEDISKSKGENGKPVGVAGNKNQDISVNNPEAGAKPQNLSAEKKQTSNRKYLVPKTVQKVSIKGGQITKFTVAVVVKDINITDEQLKSYQTLVAAAVGVANYGIDVNGKALASVSVKSLPFLYILKAAIIPPPITDSVMFSVERITGSPLVRPVVGFILLVVLFVMFKNFFNKTSVEATEMSSNLYDDENKQLTTSETDDRINIENDMSGIMKQLQDTASATPQSVANIMEQWLAVEE